MAIQNITLTQKFNMRQLMTANSVSEFFNKSFT